jgi:hypothetical protein
MSTRPTESLWAESLMDNRRRRRGGSATLVRALAPDHGHPPGAAAARTGTSPAVGRTALVGRQNGASALDDPGDTAPRIDHPRYAGLSPGQRPLQVRPVRSRV